MNNINKVICEGVVRSLNLPAEDVLFLYRRAGIESTRYPCIEFYRAGVMCGLNDRNYFRFVVSLINLLAYRIKRFDCFIESVSQGEPFEAYVPHVYQDDLALVSSHKLCSKINVVEEGDASYAKERFLDPLGKGLKRRNFWRYSWVQIVGLEKRIGGLCFFPDDSMLGKAFCLSSDAFPFYTKSKTVLSARVCLGRSLENSLESGSMILIDPFVSLKRIDRSVYLDNFNKFVCDLSGRLQSTRLFVSFHPTIRCDSEFMRSILEILECHKIDFEVFDGNAERLIGAYANFSLYGLVSSSMRYGRALDAEVYSWLSKFENEDFVGKSELLEYYKEIGVDLI